MNKQLTFKDEMILSEGKPNEILELSIGKVKVVENDDCDGCIVQELKDKSYKISCHHFCRKNFHRPVYVKFLKVDE